MAKTNPFGNIADTLRGYAPPPAEPVDPIKQAADHLRMRGEMPPNAGPQTTLRGTPADPAFHGNGQYGAPPNPGATNAAAGAGQAAGAEAGVPKPPAGQAVAGSSDGVRNPKVGWRDKLTNAGRATGNFLTSSGEAGSNLTGAFKSVASGVESGLRPAAQVLGKAGSVLASAGAPIAYLDATNQGFNTDTEQYAKRFGMENTEPGILRDSALRLGGVISDAGDALAFGAPKSLGWYRDVAGDPNSVITKAAQRVRPGLVNNDNMGQAGQPTAPAVPTRIPFEQTPQASYSNEGNNYRGANPALREQYVGQQALDADLKNSMSNASLQKANPGGQVMKTVDENGRVTYSGGSVRGLVSLTDGNGKALPGQPGGGLVQGTGDGTTRFASPNEMDRYRAGQAAAQSSGNAFQDAVNARLRGMGVNSERDLSTKTLNALYTAVDSQLRDRQAVATNQVQQENNRQMSLDRQLQATSAERVKQMEISQMERKRQVMQQAIAAATPKDKNGKPTGEPDRTVVQQYLADAGFTDLAEAQGKLVTGVQGQTEKRQAISKNFQDALARNVVVPVFKDGVRTGERDAAAEADVVARILSTRSDLANADPGELDKILPKLVGEIIATNAINAAGSDRGLGWRGSYIPSYNNPIPSEATPRPAEFYKGKRLEQKGFWNGAGSEGGNWTLRDSSGWFGQEHDLGILNADAVRHIQAQIEASKQLGK